MYKRGMAYRQSASQWWCPQCQTILANEQVENGYCWRHTDQLVERKELEQWYFRITDYAQELLTALDALDWPEPILAMQRNWIGRSEGAEIKFTAHTPDGSEVVIPVFTTRPDTVFGATFMVLSPEHPDVNRIVTDQHRARVVQYQQVAARETEIARLSTEREKTGVNTGAFAVNPFTGERIPIWIADYVLVTYVPAPSWPFRPMMSATSPLLRNITCRSAGWWLKPNQAPFRRRPSHRTRRSPAKGGW